MRLAAPDLLKLRPEGGHEQHGQTCHPIERQVEEFARARIDPMRILEHHQYGPALGQSIESMQQRVEHQLSLSLRTEAGFGGSVRQ